MVPVFVSWASISGSSSWLFADALAKFIIPEESGIAGLWEASARAVILVPVQAIGANGWSASASALFIVEDFGGTANSWSADAFVEGNVKELVHGAVLWLVSASALVNVEVFSSGASNWAASAASRFLRPEGWHRVGSVVWIKDTRAVALDEEALAGVSVPVSVGQDWSLALSGNVDGNAVLWDANTASRAVSLNVPVVTSHALIRVVLALARFGVEELTDSAERGWAALALASGEVP